MGACSPGRRSPAPNRPSPPVSSTPASRCADWNLDFHLLLQAVEQSVVPRLRVQARRDVRQGTWAVAQAALEGQFDTAHVEDYLQALMRGEAEAWDFLQRHVAAGATVPALCLRLIAPTARRLGELWNDDSFTFADVTIGMGRLHAQLRALGRTLPAEPQHNDTGLYHAVFGAGPGEQHSLGLSMVADFFRAAGWHVHTPDAVGAAGILEALRQHPTDLLGLSVSVERHTRAMADFIAECRATSCNRHLVVMLGGHLVSQRPALVDELGADAMAGDAREAMLTGLELVARRKESR